MIAYASVTSMANMAGMTRGAALASVSTNAPSMSEQIYVRPRASDTVALRSLNFERDDEFALSAIARVEGSRIPDFSSSVLYGKEYFDHTKFP